MNQVPDFATFFRTLWNHDPFPWQSMLAERVAQGTWPKALDLPTASGKTACIEIALQALAAQAGRVTADRTAPRRIWFVVDRRVVVDEAYARATRIATALNEARDGVLGNIAARLREISGTERPLAVARLRGGVFRDDGWARLPSQPAVITSTVDQLGSRLLFRGYGHSRLTAPIFAGLAAHDSLILLDEAHCSVPFLQTLRAIETFRGPRWAEQPVPTPFAFVILSATPPRDIPREGVFPGAGRNRALDDPRLDQRLRASKRATLVVVKTGAQAAVDPLVSETVGRAAGYLDSGKQRVVIMVNRVRTAHEIASALSERVAARADVILLTGRMRPYERDRVVDRWQPYLRAASPLAPIRPIVLVTTQCLEVGADFSFDVLITECASLDALRQRFGRLDRMGTAGTSLAAIVIRDIDADPDKAEPDPIYGSALAATWALLKEHADDDSVDFGVAPLDAMLAEVDDLSPCLARAPDAPMLLPAHLDLLCQTSSQPHPEPDVPLFLHGKERGAPEVQVVWRTDLSPAPGDWRAWADTIALCPPVSGEMLAVPLHQFRRFLQEVPQADEASDVEGLPAPADQPGAGRVPPCLAWRGRDRSRILWRAETITPGDVIVVPAAYGMSGLGQATGEEALGGEGLDIWERALEASARPLALRLHHAVLAPWLGCPPLKELVELVKSPEVPREALDDAIDAVLAYRQENDDGPLPPPDWWLDGLRKARKGQLEAHPATGVVLAQRGTRRDLRKAELDLFADDDDLTAVSGEAVPFDGHTELVHRTVAKLAERCLPTEYRVVLERAALWHDAGKLDARFQVLLHQGDELAALVAEEPLAKSSDVPRTQSRRRAIREASGLPEDFRHEMLSMQLAARHANGWSDDPEIELFLHLVSSHHGYGRPFAPVCLDAESPGVIGTLGKIRIELSAADRRGLIPPHRLDSGVTERFWRLVRRYGWWGLAYLESLMRLGDWYASGLQLRDASVEEPAHEPA